jgi:hypothetical protein
LKTPKGHLNLTDLQGQLFSLVFSMSFCINARGDTPAGTAGRSSAAVAASLRRRPYRAATTLLLKNSCVGSMLLL